MRSVNLLVLLGNVGNDPEVRSTTSGARVATIPVATTYGWGTGDERQEKTEWHRVIAWNALSDLAENYIRKGDRIYIQGRVQYRSYEDKEGITRYTTEVVASEIVLLGVKPNAERPGSAGRPTAAGTDDGEYPAEPAEEYDEPEQPAPRRQAPGRPAQPAAAKRAPSATKRAPAKRR